MKGFGGIECIYCNTEDVEAVCKWIITGCGKCRSNSKAENGVFGTFTQSSGKEKSAVVEAAEIACGWAAQSATKVDGVMVIMMC